MLRKRIYLMVCTALLAALAIVLMFFETPLLFFPSFLKMDISDLPAVLASMAYGPLFGVLVELIKNLVHVLSSKTVGIGELANLLVGVALVVPFGFFRNLGAIKDERVRTLTLGASGTLLMTAVAFVSNLFIFIPAYEAVSNVPPGTYLVMMPALLLFNVVKGVAITAISVLVQKRIISVLLKGLHTYAK